MGSPSPSLLLALLSVAAVACLMLLNMHTHHHHHQQQLMQRDLLTNDPTSLQQQRRPPPALLPKMPAGNPVVAGAADTGAGAVAADISVNRLAHAQNINNHINNDNINNDNNDNNRGDTRAPARVPPEEQQQAVADVVDAALDKHLREQRRMLQEQLAQFMETLKALDSDSRSSVLKEILASVNKQDERMAQLEEKLSRLETAVVEPMQTSQEKLDAALKQLQEIKEQAGSLTEAFNRHYGYKEEPLDLAAQQNEQGPTPPPEPRVPMEDFVMLVHLHLVGNITHEEFEDALGINTTATQEILSWPSLDEPREDGQNPAKARYFQMLDAKYPSRIQASTLAHEWCIERNGSGTNFILNHCMLGGSYQHWLLDSLGRLHTAFDQGDCLDGTGLAVGDDLVANRCTRKAKGQRWNYVRPGAQSQAGFLINRETKLCIDANDVLQAWNATHRPRVVVRQCDASCTQLWTISDNVTTIFDLMPSADEARAMIRHKEEQLAESKRTGASLGLIYEREADEQLSRAKSKMEAAGKDASTENAEKRDRIACWVMTNPKNHHTKALAINSTWGRDCDLLLFMTTKHQAGLNTIVLSLGEEEDRHFLWRKSIMSWGFMYAHLIDKYDWFIRADDDTFFNMDNLRSFLKGYSPKDPHFFGRRLKINDDEFYSGGAGTILSHNALSQFGEAMEDDILGVVRAGDTFADDMEIAVSMRRLGIPTEDTRDEQGRERFFVLTLTDERNTYRANDPGFWYFEFSYYSPKEGEDSSSPWWIASHYTAPPTMMLMEAMHELKCEAAGQHPWRAKVQAPTP
ncbi:hypothetical protein PTSG_03488 [Salpingoeca rosetta]|uniref:N-acetylgalactosaminide beta-1,3-galactosyltransferase n=1 Tax=Salpingoeca rosetta (strain ATCC 50818 / BSB-021) TaxID=946362 RepID=F2U5R4_SALR5|nr:uncharacterized protein PTSG_03488 [Salpingoeca rosetta]EGD82855.1 hypothetical protein PTSG_03488 [Salpingoeca rosetta]|eukprot:XP_004995219.1 hypothetical protein PTSG_03488 [Salpingoeca rosetta]